MPSGLQISTSVPLSVSSRAQQRNGTSVPLRSASPRSVPPSHHGSAPKPTYTPPPHPPLPPIPDASTTHRSAFYPPTITSATSHTPPPSHRPSEYVHDLSMYEQPANPSDLIQEEQRSHAAPAPSAWGPASPTNGDYPMDLADDYVLGSPGQPMDIQTSPMVQEYPARPPAEPDLLHDAVHAHANKLSKLGSLTFGKKRGGWGLGMFGHGDKAHALPPVEELPAAASSSSTPSLKRTQSSSTDSRSLAEVSPVHDAPLDAKKARKEAERIQRDAEKQRRVLAQKTLREQARAVMDKRNEVLKQTATNNELEWKWQHSGSLLAEKNPRPAFADAHTKGKQAASGPIRQGAGAGANAAGAATVNAAAGRFGEPPAGGDWRRDNERVAKVRRRDFDDDHSMSSSDVHSIGRMSSISFATVDSDPGPARLRHRPSLFGISRMTSTSSLRTSFDDFPTSARSSNSFSLEQQLVNDFHARTSVDPPLSGSVSPPPMQMLSLSPSLSPSPPWIQVQHPKEDSTGAARRHQQLPSYISMTPPPPQNPLHLTLSGSQSAFEFGQVQGYPPSPFGHPPSPGLAPKSAINPIFKVVSYAWACERGYEPDAYCVAEQPPLPSPTGDRLSSPTALPPFSHLEAVAEGEIPQLSPMSFLTPEDD